MHRRTHLALAAFGLAGLLPAQAPIGADAPALEIEKAWNGGPETFSELAGKLVFIEFFATW